MDITKAKDIIIEIQDFHSLAVRPIYRFPEELRENCIKLLSIDLILIANICCFEDGNNLSDEELTVIAMFQSAIFQSEWLSPEIHKAFCNWDKNHSNLKTACSNLVDEYVKLANNIKVNVKEALEAPHKESENGLLPYAKIVKEMDAEEGTNNFKNLAYVLYKFATLLVSANEENTDTKKKVILRTIRSLIGLDESELEDLKTFNASRNIVNSKIISNNMDPGFVYALINPSFPGLVKIGKTKKEPQERAKELSSVSGLPTSFEVAYELYVDDCSYAENYLHTLLEQRGYRIADNREFFKIPLKEIINLMLDTKKIIHARNSEGVFLSKTVESSEDSDSNSEENNPWYNILEQAHDYQYGDGDTIQDDKEALKLYQQAVRLGSADACFALGQLYESGINKYCEENLDEALEYYKEGVKLGAAYMLGYMGLVYKNQGNTENAKKCFKQFIKSKDFNNYRKDSTQNYSSRFAREYLQIVRKTNALVECVEELYSIKDFILFDMEKALVSDKESYKNSKDDFFKKYYRALVKENEQDIEFIKKLFFKDKLPGKISTERETASNNIHLDINKTIVIFIVVVISLLLLKLFFRY